MVRVKRRYFVLNVNFEDKSQRVRNKYKLGEELLQKVEQLYGEFGLAAVKNAFSFKYTNPETGIFYVRVDRNASEMLSSSLPLITKIESKPATISCLVKAATIRHAHLFLKNYHEKAIKEASSTETPKVKLGFKQNIIKKRKKRVHGPRDDKNKKKDA